MKKDAYQYMQMFSGENDKNKTEDFLTQYWLSEDDYLRDWLSARNHIFSSGFLSLPSMVLKENGNLFYAFIGGGGFDEQEYSCLKTFMLEISETEFSIVENYNPNCPFSSILPNGDEVFHPPARFHFPVNTDWSTLQSCKNIFNELINMPHKDYFVIGRSKKWGKYCANEFDLPMDLYSISEDVSEIFEDCFSVMEFKNLDVWASIPIGYRKIVKWIV